MNQNGIKIGTAAIAAILLLAAPANAQSTNFDTDFGVGEITGTVVKLTQTGAFSGATGQIHHGDANVAIQYAVDFFDRNGESDLLADYTLKVYVAQPDATASDGAYPTLLAAQTANSKVVPGSDNLSFGSEACLGTPVDGDITLVEGSTTDTTPLNGVRSCTFTINWNVGGNTPSGEYTVFAYLLDGGSTIVGEGFVNTGIYETVSAAANLVGYDGGAFAPAGLSSSFSPTSNGVTLASTRFDGDIRVTNSGSGTIDVSITLSDLVHDTDVTVADLPKAHYLAKEFHNSIGGSTASEDFSTGTTAPVAGVMTNTNDIQQGQFTQWALTYDISSAASALSYQNGIMPDGTYSGTVQVDISADGSLNYWYDAGTTSYSPVNVGQPSLDRSADPEGAGYGAITVA